MKSLKLAKFEIHFLTIVAIEKGKYSPSLELAFKIAHCFNLQLEEVFTYKPQ